MDYHVYLRKGLVFVPTTGRVEKGLLRDIEPVSAISISNAEGVRQALLAAITRGNPPTPHYSGGNFPPPAVLKYAGVSSWSAFARDATSWNMQEENGDFKIVGYRKHTKGYWVQDADQVTILPRGATVDDMVGRMIEILQKAART